MTYHTCHAKHHFTYFLLVYNNYNRRHFFHTIILISLLLSTQFTRSINALNEFRSGGGGDNNDSSKDDDEFFMYDHTNNSDEEDYHQNANEDSIASFINKNSKNNKNNNNGFNSSELSSSSRDNDYIYYDESEYNKTFHRNFNNNISDNLIECNKDICKQGVFKWHANKTKNLYVGGIFPMVGGWPGGQACLPSAIMALNEINSNATILPEYKLNLNWFNSEV